MAYFKSERYDPVLYHTELGFPVGTGRKLTAALASLSEQVTGTAHYQERHVEKRLPIAVTSRWIRKAKLIETQVVDGVIHRILVRGKHTAGLDLCVVVDLLRGELVTGWTNDRNDWHRLTSERSARYTPVVRG